jgi:hypothetical protein
MVVAEMITVKIDCDAGAGAAFPVGIWAGLLITPITARIIGGGVIIILVGCLTKIDIIIFSAGCR